MPSYLSVLRVRGVARVLAAQLTARLPAGMIGLGILLHLQAQTGSYAFAGSVVAVLSAGQAVAGPLGGRAAGRWGSRPVLLAAVGASAAGIVAVALIPAATAPLAVLLAALVVGITTPPVQPVLRSLYPQLVDESRIMPLIAMDASLQEIIFVVAPVVVALVAAQAGGTAALLVVAGILVVGGAWFALSPEVGGACLARSRHAIGRVALSAPVFVGIGMGFVLVAASAAVEVGVIAADPEHPLSAGLLLAVYSVASLVGGLAVGHARIGRWSLARRMAVVAGGLAVCAAWPQFVPLAIGLAVAGLGVAPVFAVTYAAVVRAVDSSESPEAFGWLGTGALVGAAAGSAVAGLAIDAAGARGAFVVAVVSAVVGVILAVVTSRRMPDLGPAADDA